jgi:hypothetical protein
MKFLAELPLSSEPKEAGTAKTHGGEFPIRRASVNGTIELGRYRLELSEVLFSDVRPGADPPVGNIGAAVLRDFAVTLDSKNRRILLER